MLRKVLVGLVPAVLLAIAGLLVAEFHSIIAIAETAGPGHARLVLRDAAVRTMAGVMLTFPALAPDSIRVTAALNGQGRLLVSSPISNGKTTQFTISAVPVAGGATPPKPEEDGRFFWWTRADTVLVDWEPAIAAVSAELDIQPLSQRGDSTGLSRRRFYGWLLTTLGSFLGVVFSAAADSTSRKQDIAHPLSGGVTRVVIQSLSRPGDSKRRVAAARRMLVDRYIMELEVDEVLDNAVAAEKRRLWRRMDRAELSLLMFAYQRTLNRRMAKVAIHWAPMIAAADVDD